MADGSMVALPSELLTSPRVVPTEIYLYALISYHTHVTGDILGMTVDHIAAAHGLPRRLVSDAWAVLCAAGWAGSAGPGLMLHVYTERVA